MKISNNRVKNDKRFYNVRKITDLRDLINQSVELYSDDEDFVLSDNFFDINGDEVRVKVLEGKAINVKARSVYDIR